MQAIAEATDASTWVAQAAHEWREKMRANCPDLFSALLAFETIGTTQVEALQYPTKRVPQAPSDPEKDLYEWPTANRRIRSELAQCLPRIEALGGTGIIQPFPFRCYLLVVKSEQAAMSTRINQDGYPLHSGHHYRLWFRFVFAASLVNSLPLKVFPCFRAFFVFCFTFHHVHYAPPLSHSKNR
jgi:hypothetical protein